MVGFYGKINEALIAGNAEEVNRLCQKSIDSGASALDVLEKGLSPGMDVVGQRFKASEIFIPEVIRSAKAMHRGLDILRPLLAAGGVKSVGTLVIGTVEGDLHDIGANLVKMMFEGAGFQVISLGTNVKSQLFVDAVNKHKPQLLGMSAMLTSTMPKMEETINALKKAGIRDQIKVMIGGAPLTEEYGQKIGADGYAPNATEAVEKGREFVA